MKKHIKISKTIKKIVVKCSDFWKDEIQVDSEIFDDVYMEAATRAVEKRKDLPGFKVTVIIECWEKKDEKNPSKHFVYNTYRVFLNAALHGKAEILRVNFLTLYKVDLQKESIRGSKGEEVDGTTTTTKSTKHRKSTTKKKKKKN